MNVFKKTGALALVLTLAVCFCAMASATALGTSTTTGDDITGLSFKSSITPGARVGGTATYTVGSVTYITGSDSDTAPSVTFTSGSSVTITAGSAANSESVGLTLSASGAANGIYEFPITQALTGDLSAGSNPTTLYLSVVVAGGKVTQAVLHTESGGNSHYAVNGSKVDGFTYDPDYTAGGDVTLQKKVAGTYGALNTGNFKFVIAISTGASSTYGSLPFTVSSTSTLSIDNSGVADATGAIFDGNMASSLNENGAAKFGVTLNGTTGGGATLTISGLPKDATVTITEDDTTTAETAATHTAGGSAEDLSLTDKTGSVTVLETGTEAVVFTNTYSEISMTGVTLRYAPYLLTLGAGLVVLPMTRTYRRREDF